MKKCPVCGGYTFDQDVTDDAIAYTCYYCGYEEYVHLEEIA